MNCPEHLLLKAFKGKLCVWVYYLDIPRELVPLSVWLNPLRYEVIFSFGKKAKVLNRRGRANDIVDNWLYKHIRPRMCKWFGIHQRFNFRGGDKQCHHCDIGRDQSHD